MASQQRGRSRSGGPRGQVMGAAPSAYPFLGAVAGPGLARHSSGSIPYAISTTLTSPPTSMQQQYMQAANATHRPSFREQQISPSSPHGHISPTTHGSISPRNRNPLEMSFPVNNVDPGAAFPSAPNDYNFPQTASGLPEVSPQQQHALTTFLVESAMQADGQATGQSVNPTDLLGQATSPFQADVASSEAPGMERNASSNSYTNASLDQYGYSPAQQSPGDSLTPASAAFPQGQPLPDWTGMLHSPAYQGAAFQGHRRTPSEHSDVSSAAPSPFMANTDSFDQAEQQRSPLLQPKSEAMYQDALGIEQFTISDDGRSHGLSPGPSPGVSPRLSPHGDLNLGQGATFVLPPSVVHSQFQALGTSEAYPVVKSERIPSLQLNNGSGELGANGAMAPPEINIEYAAPSKQPTLEPPQAVGDGNALSLPERGRKARHRAHSDPYVGGSPLPRSPSAHSSFSFDSRRSLSPHSPVVGGSPSSSTKSSRRSSTSSIPNRDYMIGLADPGRSGPGAPDSKRVQKHPATFQCHLCPKRFTRAYNLRSHLRTHTDERPFVCTHCGKAFARQHDRKRHEGLHSGEKKFVCRGELKSGKPWGCGRRFARADALGRHFRSEAGRACIKPLLDEEATQRQRKQQQQQQQQQQEQQHAARGHLNEQNHLLSQPDPSGLSSHHQATADLLRSNSSGSNSMTGLADLNGNNNNNNNNNNNGLSGSLAFTLPQALLAQYPVLATLQWDQLGPAGADEADVSGRSSFDASSGGEFYDEDADASGYVSGPGADFGTVPPGHHERWPNDGFLSDFGGTGR